MTGPKPVVLPITPRGSSLFGQPNISNLAGALKEELFSRSTVRRQGFVLPAEYRDRSVEDEPVAFRGDSVTRCRSLAYAGLSGPKRALPGRYRVRPSRKPEQERRAQF